MNNENIVSTNTNEWSSTCLFISKYVRSYSFYIHILLLLSISIIQLRFSVVYKDDCTIDKRILLYLFAIAIIQIIYSFNGILLIIFSLLYDKYQYMIRFLLICFLIQHILIIFLLIWFIIGNYLIFSIRNTVQYTNSYNTHTYCDYTLYQTAFWTIIMYYILIILFSIILVLTHIKWFLNKLKHLKNKCTKSSNNDSYEN
jgi:hypothetical protein